MSKKLTIKSAEAAIKKMGGTIEDEKIFMPEDIHASRGEDGYEEFWRAYTWLRTYHDYDCDLDDPIAEIDIDEFLKD
jgi:hypothetical protein